MTNKATTPSRDCFRSKPIRSDNEGNYVAIDGHNLIAVRLYRNERVNVHIAHSALDGLPATTVANIQRNYELRKGFEDVLVRKAHLIRAGIDNFSDLIARYPDVFK